MPDLPPIATEVRARREELGLTQEGVVAAAKRAGRSISLATFQAIEQGKRTALQPEKKAALAAALGWPPRYVDDLLAGRTHAPQVNGDRLDIRRVIAEELRAMSLEPEERGIGDVIRSMSGTTIVETTDAIQMLLDLLRAEQSRRAHEA